MSLPVDLDTLLTRIAEFGNTPYLVTVNDEGTPHVVSVTLDHDANGLIVPVGRRTRANVEQNQGVTLLWPPRPDPAYCMIVDATVVSFNGGRAEITLEPRSAVLHRVAGAAGAGPSCVPIAGLGSDH